AAPSTKLGQETTVAAIPPGGFADAAFPISSPPPSYLDGTTHFFARIESTPAAECRTDNNQSPAVSGACGYCGACGAACVNCNGTTTCSAGGWQAACNTGFADCDGNPTNGCGRPFNTDADCSTRGPACSGSTDVASP